MSAFRTTTSTDSRTSLTDFMRAYPVLRGYVLLPWLLPMSVWLIGETGIYWLGPGPWILQLVTVVAAIFGHRAVVRWYDGRYGRVWQEDGGDRFSAGFILGRLVIQSVVFLALIYLLPPILINWFGVSAEWFGPVYHWPWVLVSVALIVVAWLARPYFAFLAFFGIALLVLAVLPLGEFFGVADGRHLLRTSYGGQGLRILLVLGYSLASHATLVRYLKQFQDQFGVADDGGPTSSEAVRLKEGGNPR